MLANHRAIEETAQELARLDAERPALEAELERAKSDYEASLRELEVAEAKGELAAYDARHSTAVARNRLKEIESGQDAAARDLAEANRIMDQIEEELKRNAEHNRTT